MGSIKAAPSLSTLWQQKKKYDPPWTAQSASFQHSVVSQISFFELASMLSPRPRHNTPSSQRYTYGFLKASLEDNNYRNNSTEVWRLMCRDPRPPDIPLLLHWLLAPTLYVVLYIDLTFCDQSLHWTNLKPQPNRNIVWHSKTVIADTC